MVTSICQAIFIKILVMNILTILIQHVCECTQSSVDPYKLSFRLRCLPEHELVLDHSNSCRLYPYSYSTYPTLIRVLLLIPWFENHNSVAFELKLVSCSYGLIFLPFSFFWLSTDAHIRSLVDHQILCWILFDTVILILLIQYVCECTQSSINPSKLSFRLRHHFWTWAGSRPNYWSSIVPLVYPTYPSLIRASASDHLFWKS